jgi:hypothetical protein
MKGRFLLLGVTLAGVVSFAPVKASAQACASCVTLPWNTGNCSNTDGTACLGISSGSSPAIVGQANSGVGVQGTAEGANGVGVLATEISFTGTTYGLEASVSSPAGYGIYAYNASTGTAAGNGAGSGVYGSSSAVASSGVYGVSTGTNGVGLYGVGREAGVVGTNTVGGFGLLGEATNGGYGVGGSSDSHYGVFGASTSSYGVYGSSTGNSGIFGTTSGHPYAGVYGSNTNAGGGWGVRGDAIGPGTGVYGTNTNDTTGGWAGYFAGRVYVSTGLVVNGTCVSGNCSSDLRLKQNVQSLTGSLDVLAALRPVTFEWKNPQERGYSSGTQTGFIAQEVEKVKPDWIGVDDKGFKTLNTRGLEPMLVDAVRTLKANNDALRADDGVLRAKLAGVEDRLRLLEAGRSTATSGFGGGSLGLGLLALAGAVFASRRRSGSADQAGS